MIDKLHLIKDDQEYLEAIKTEMKNALIKGMDVEYNNFFEPIITFKRADVQDWFTEKDTELLNNINSATDPEIKDILLVIHERFRLYTFIATRSQEHTEELRAEYYQRKKQQ